MPVNSTHPDYDFALPDWLRARDVLAGEDAVKAAGEKYLPRLDSQSDDEFWSYRKRASFFNATGRTAEGFVGLIFRRAPFIKVPEAKSGVGRAMAQFVNDADMLGTTLAGYAKSGVSDGAEISWQLRVSASYPLERISTRHSVTAFAETLLWPAPAAVETTTP